MKHTLFVAAAATALLGLAACEPTGDAADALATASSPREPLEMFGGQRPSWPSELDTVALGQTPQQWREALPDLDSEGLLRSRRFAETDYRWHVDERSGRVTALLVHFRSTTAGSPIEALERSWGKALAATDDQGRARHYWFAPEEKLRAQLRPGLAEGQWVLEIGHYLPLEDLIGRAPGPLAFEADVPLLGLDADAIARAWPRSYHVPEGEAATAGTLYLPPAELDAVWTTVDPHFDSRGHLEHYSLTINTTAQRRAAVHELLETRFGAPLVGSGPDEAPVAVYLAARHGLRVRATDTLEPSGVRLVVERYLPLAHLLAPLEHRRLAFEQETPWIGHLTRQRFDTTLADRSDDGGGQGIYDDGWMSLPPIEYDDSPVPVFPEFGDDDVVVRYRLGLGYGLVAQGRAAILAAFEQALGAPQPQQAGGAPLRYVFPGTPQVTLEDSPEAREWIVRIGAPPAP